MTDQYISEIVQSAFLLGVLGGIAREATRWEGVLRAKRRRRASAIPAGRVAGTVMVSVFFVLCGGLLAVICFPDMQGVGGVSHQLGAVAIGLGTPGILSHLAAKAVSFIPEVPEQGGAGLRGSGAQDDDEWGLGASFLEN